MTDKFIPFNPETAKNGDVLYAFCNPALSYIYVGPCPNRTDACVTYNPRDSGYGYCWNESMVVKAPKKTVWVNVYKDKSAAWYSAEHVAFQYCLKDDKYIGTYPLEIDDVA